MAIAFVRKTDNLNAASVTTNDFSLSASSVSGNLLIIAVRVSVTGRTVTISNTAETVFATKVLARTDGGARELNIYYFENVPALSQVRVAVSGAALNMHFTAHEVSGCATSSVLDVSASQSGASSTSLDSTNAATSAVADSYVFGGACWQTAKTATLGSGFSNLAVSLSGASALVAAEGKIVSSTGAYNATFTTDSAQVYACGVVVFKGGTTTSETTLSVTNSGSPSFTGQSVSLSALAVDNGNVTAFTGLTVAQSSLSVTNVNVTSFSSSIIGVAALVIAALNTTSFTVTSTASAALGVVSSLVGSFVSFISGGSLESYYRRYLNDSTTVVTPGPSVNIDTETGSENDDYYRRYLNDRIFR